jgi:hypothetical protein
VHRLHEILRFVINFWLGLIPGLSLFLAWANTHDKSMDIYVDLVASTRPILTLSGCRSREGLLDMRKLARTQKKTKLGPKLRQRRTQIQ